ncbi:hypothetical protein [Clostridium thermarum]|uniref:hypothetical protein n=1 Tax=Clostridium thermarum TaxID=1716543 RepID=UPI0013D54E7A|nr:hypothetical protein [Clostridium thermarum]
MVDSTKKSNEIEKENKAAEYLNSKLGEKTSQEFKSVKYASALEIAKKKKDVH